MLAKAKLTRSGSSCALSTYRTFSRNSACTKHTVAQHAQREETKQVYWSGNSRGERYSGSGASAESYCAQG
jgi:hypothetical protein